MDLAGSVVPWISPTGAFLDAHDCSLFAEKMREGRNFATDQNACEEAWTQSNLNPCKRVDHLALEGTTGWRIDGCTSRGTQFLALPDFLMPHLIPQRIDVYIPDQSKHSRLLRRTLRSGAPFYTFDRRVNGYGITQLILTILDRWTGQMSNFREVFEAMPFGSKIIITEISCSISRMEPRFIPNLHLEKKMLTISELQGLWNFPQSVWPPQVELDHIQHHSQLNDAISLVRISHLYQDTLVVFKSSTSDYKHIYHELKLLLTLPCYHYVIKAPLNIVVKQSRLTNEIKVFGFILPFYSGGNLSTILADRAKEGSLRLRDQLRWARQITTALISIHAGPARYHPGIKPDNVLVTAPNDDILIIDFEQNANWETFTAPEVHQVENLEKLINSNLVPEPKQTRYKQILARHLPERSERESATTYRDPPNGYYRAWNALTKTQQESAAVYALGKVLWCIFEGCHHTRNSMQEDYVQPSPREFPEFYNTPDRLRSLIKACTLGAREWSSDGSEVVRVDDMFFSRDWDGSVEDELDAAAEAMSSAKKIWTERVAEMEAYLEAKERWEQGSASEIDEIKLGFPLRPSFKDVLEAIEAEELERAHHP